MPEHIVINGTSIKKGENTQVSLNTYRLPTRTNIEIPVYVYRSEQQGPVVLLLAGMHGDEINGIEIIRRLITKNYFTHLLWGSVIAIPVINIISFLSGTRTLPDGRDLNRCFPGTDAGSLGSRIANDLMKQILPQINMGIDFHTGGASISNYPQMRCVFKDPVALELAKQFGAPFILNSTYRDKSFRKEAARRQKNILVFEGGESGRFDEFAIEEGINGCMRLFNHLNMLNAPVPEVTSKIIESSTWIRARMSGLFHPRKKYGALIRKNETLGTISDPFGENESHIKSPANGYIVGLNNKPVVNQGDAIIHIGIEDNIYLDYSR